MLALSVSISTSSSPRFTSSPSDLSHLRIVPSSIESERRGIATSAMPGSVPLPGPRAAARGGGCPCALQVAEGGDDRLDDLRLARGGDLLERLGGGHREGGARDPGDGGVEVVGGLLLDQRGEVGPGPAVRPALLH